MKKMNLMEIVILALIAVVMGVVSLGLDAIYGPITAALGPIGGAILYGAYLLSASIPLVLIKKPGAALVGSFFTGLVNLLLGSPYGINIIVAALLQGLGFEIGAALFGYKKINFTSLAIGSVFAMILVTIRDYFVFGFASLGNMMLPIFAIRIISSILLGAGLALVIGNAIEKTGVMNNVKRD